MQLTTNMDFSQHPNLPSFPNIQSIGSKNVKQKLPAIEGSSGFTSEQRSKPLYMPFHWNPDWFIFRDPYIGLWNNPHIIGACISSPISTPTNQGPKWTLKWLWLFVLPWPGAPSRLHTPYITFWMVIPRVQGALLSSRDVNKHFWGGGRNVGVSQNNWPPKFVVGKSNLYWGGMIEKPL